VLVLFLSAAVLTSNEPVADRNKRVSATKFEKGKPLKVYEFTFAQEADGYTTFFTKFEDETLTPLRLIEYRNGEKREPNLGVCDSFCGDRYVKPADRFHHGFHLLTRFGKVFARQIQVV